MAHHSFLRASFLALAALFAASRGAAAQQPGVIRVGATVTAAAGSVTLADSASAAPLEDTQRVRIAGIGRVDVQTGPGAAIRVVSPTPNALRTTHRIIIDFVGN